MGVVQQELSKWERGKAAPRSMADIESVAAYIGKTPHEVVLLAAGLSADAAPADLAQVAADLRRTAEQLNEALGLALRLVERQTGQDEVESDA